MAFQSDFRPEDVKELVEEISLPIELQAFTVDWYAAKIHEVCRTALDYNWEQNGNIYTIGRYVVRTATIDDEVDMLLVCKVDVDLDIQSKLVAQLTESEYFALLDRKEDGVRLRLKEPVVFGASEDIKIQSQIRLRFLVVPSSIFNRFVETASCWLFNSQVHENFYRGRSPRRE
jgi:hypothetical protein